jgi:hypothetical protein
MKRLALVVFILLIPSVCFCWTQNLTFESGTTTGSDAFTCVNCNMAHPTAESTICTATTGYVHSGTYALKNVIETGDYDVNNHKDLMGTIASGESIWIRLYVRFEAGFYRGNSFNKGLRFWMSDGHGSYVGSVSNYFSLLTESPGVRYDSASITQQQFIDSGTGAWVRWEYCILNFSTASERHIVWVGTTMHINQVHESSPDSINGDFSLWDQFNDALAGNNPTGTVYVDDIVITNETPSNTCDGYPCIGSSDIVAAPQVFPGAEGYGTDTTGGRHTGAQLCVVNSTDAGSTGYCGTGGSPSLPTNVCNGTLEWCAEQGTAPRIIIFSTGGRIDLDSNIDIVDQYVTVFGQTAPGSGIVVSSDDDGTGDDTLKVRTSDVLIQGMRIRTDDYNYTTSACEATRENTLDVSDAAGALNNIVIDRCSLSWACNEILNLGWYTGNTNFTVSNSILSEGFYVDSAGKFGLALNSGDIVGITFHHNLLAHNASRMPKLGAHTGTDDALHTMNHIDDVELINNVLYDWHFSGPSLWTNQEYIGGSPRTQDADFIGNYFLKGTETTAGAYEFLLDEDSGYLASTADVYLSGNVSNQHDCTTGAVVQWTNCVDGDDNQTTREVARTQTGSGAAVTQTAANAYTYVLATAGAQSTLNPRDAVDTRVVADVVAGTGAQIENATGLWPTYSAGTAPTDTDLDGLPDAWESAHSLNPNDATTTGSQEDWSSDYDANGYWEIEDYAAYLLNFSDQPGSCTLSTSGTGSATLGAAGTGSMTLQ